MVDTTETEKIFALLIKKGSSNFSYNHSKRLGNKNGSLRNLK